MRLLVSALAIAWSTASWAAELGVFLDRETVVLANGIFASEVRPLPQDLEAASHLMRWLDEAAGAPTAGDPFEGILFNVSFQNRELKVDPVEPVAAQALLGGCSVTNMNGVPDPRRRGDRNFVAFALHCSDRSAVVTMTLQGEAISAAYIHNGHFVPVVMQPQ